jgi:hypothetical protein
MSPRPEEDPQLTHFLKHHRPVAPSASDELEERLMAMVNNTPQAVPLGASRRQRHDRRVLWLLPSAIAATLVAVVAPQWFMPQSPSDAQLAELETFIESTWQGTVAEQPTSTDTEELYPLVDEPGVN